MLVEDLLGCTMESFISYLTSKLKEGMTLENYGKWHIDHIKPIALFDTTSKEQIKECFHYTNLQPLWARENFSKGAKYEDRAVGAK